MYTTLRIEKEIMKKIKHIAIDNNKTVEEMAKTLIIKGFHHDCKCMHKDK